MNLKIINADFSICKIKSINNINSILNNEFIFFAKTDDEISLVCETSKLPSDIIICENEYKAFKVDGILDFSLVGILSKISSILSKNNISIFAVSTFNTDYIFIKENNFDNAINILKNEGYKFI